MEKETQMTTKITHHDIKHIAFPFSDGRSVHRPFCVTPGRFFVRPAPGCTASLAPRFESTVRLFSICVLVGLLFDEERAGRTRDVEKEFVKFVG
ncbi:hypothetical protein OUZ56_000566 [Daphnia magna]|uniref:Uncharacterized protein n=1 Tax=Daphnia magna TaxID=35525 RepID=A0ABR0A055_9CRUS|nr:hypothetical protein OUZ56_000566 [Daphnia magna]